MAAGPNYDGHCLPLSKIREAAKLRLVEILDATQGKKLLVLDQIVSGCLGMLTKHTLLLENGVEQLRYLNDDFEDAGTARSVVFIVRPVISNFQKIAQQVARFTRKSEQLDIRAYFQPRTSTVCERIFQAEGVAASISTGDFPLDFIPFDNDLLSLELQDSLKDVLLQRDWSSNFYLARALVQLQNLYGPITSIKGIGPSAQAICDSMEAMLDSQPTTQLSQGLPGLDELIVLDRACDLVTLMCTQLTYEGLVDELVGIKNGVIAYDQQNSSAKNKMALNSGDETHNFIRSRNISEVGAILKEQAAAIQKGYRESRGADLKELKEFTTKLKSLPEIQRHIDLLSHLNITLSKSEFNERIQLQHALLGDPASDAEYQLIEEMILDEEKLETVLRFLCLASLTQDGIPKNRYDSLRKEILTTYGHQHLVTLQLLQSAGLLKLSKGGRSVHRAVSKALDLTPEVTSNETPTDVSYVYSGYAPLSIRLVEAALRQSGWLGVPDEVLKLLPGPNFARQRARDFGHSNASDRKKTVLVAFAGGVTYAEIAALRFMQSQPDFDAHILIATTNFLNGQILMRSFQDAEVSRAASFAQS